MQMCVKYWEGGVKNMEMILGTSFMDQLFIQYQLLKLRNKYSWYILSSFKRIAHERFKKKLSCNVTKLGSALYQML